jgi:ribosomal protein S18 acetylase RimI-like enzyme
MKVIRFRENLLNSCAEFWWGIYEHMPYVHRPDGYQTLNTPPITPEYFIENIRWGLGCRDGASSWAGEVTEDGVFLAEEGGKIEGILVSSVNGEKRTGNILSAYVQRNARGREAADRLLEHALEHFRRLRLPRVVAAPGRGSSMEVECPIHLSLLGEGFAWEQDWKPAYPNEAYGVFLGGSLEGFRLQPEIREKIEQLRKEGIAIERVDRGQKVRLQRLDTGLKVDPFDADSNCAFVGFVNDLVVGWTFEVSVFRDEGRILAMVGPEVIPSYRRRGIGKVLHHLGMEEAVRQGAQGGWTATEIYNPARLIYQSVGWRYWYTSFGRMSRIL